MLIEGANLKTGFWGQNWQFSKKCLREKELQGGVTVSDFRGPSGRYEKTFKETYSLTPRGGFFDGRNQNRDPEPSAKPLRDSDKPTNLEMLFLRTGSTTI